MNIKSKNGKKLKHDYLLATASDLGLSGYVEIKDTVYEIVAEGDRTSVWEFVKSVTSNKIKTKFHDIVFYFSDAKGDISGFRLV